MLHTPSILIMPLFTCSRFFLTVSIGKQRIKWYNISLTCSYPPTSFMLNRHLEYNSFWEIPDTLINKTSTIWPLSKELLNIWAISIRFLLQKWKKHFPIICFLKIKWNNCKITGKASRRKETQRPTTHFSTTFSSFSAIGSPYLISYYLRVRSH